MNSLLCAAFAVVLFVVAVLAAIAWFTESPADRARRWHRAGWSQQRIADRMGCSRYRVRKLLAC